MMKLWLGFFILFSCGSFTYSQDLSIFKIEQIGDVTIIDNSKAELTDNFKEYVVSSKSDFKDKKSKKYSKQKVKNHSELDLEYSRKANPEKNKSTELVYKNSSSDTFFLNSFGQKLSAVLSFNSYIDLKEYFNYCIRYILYSPNFIVKQNTYYYLFSKDTGKLYQFFNKPPPYFI
ncbi:MULTISPECIES: hypothetical protein [Chryseobacterium]|nr:MULTISPECIES: hypothetical protein [Chryseobacterium]QQV02257.1 hypothetical protein I6I61_14475 [Chryseobacterium sp. FDAARGOS 1104]